MTLDAPAPRKSNAGLLLVVLLGFVGIVAIGSYYMFVATTTTTTISEADFVKGVTLDFGNGDSAIFYLNGEEYLLRVVKINEDESVAVKLNSVEINLDKEEERSFDLDDDGNYDMAIKFREIVDDGVYIYLGKI
jgi:hypothetical protein